MCISCAYEFQHLWDGCKCIRCYMTRNEGHDWSKDCERRATCSKVRESGYSWISKRCLSCQKYDDGHDWSMDCDKCANCGLARQNVHKWDGCATCGKTRDGEHDWSKNCEKCSKCGKTRNKGHDWQIDCERCDTCGTVRLNAHFGINQKCLRCGKRKCAECGKIQEYKSNNQRCTECGKIIRDEDNIRVPDFSSRGSVCLSMTSR
jgi:hypothetical protein